MAIYDKSTDDELEQLSSRDVGLLEPHLEQVNLQQGAMLEKAGRAVHHVYFLKRGIASVLASETGSPAVEVAILGKNDMSGASILLGTDHALHDVVMQMPGVADRIPALQLKHLLWDHADLRGALLPRVGHLLKQISNTALANARATLEVRLARRLLVCLDHMDGERIPVTHEALAQMLGVRRPGVTVALHVMEGQKLIRSTRGLCTVLDRAGLERLAAGFYRPDTVQAAPAYREDHEVALTVD